MSIIVFGASGFLGKHLNAYFKSKGEHLIGTYNSTPTEGMVQFNLLNPNIEKINTAGVKYAIICGAVTDMDLCKTDWAGTYKINVTGTKKLIEQLWEMKITVVFISTDYVFDGKKGNYSEEDDREPVLAYGLQKKEIEDFLIGSKGKKDNYIIARLGRLYDAKGKNIITNIAADLSNGKNLHLATDQVFSPSNVTDVCRAIDMLMEKHCRGTYNVCSGVAISRYTIGKMIEQTFKTRGKVIACSMGELKFTDKRPLDTSMSNTKLVKETGAKFKTLQDEMTSLRL